ncbi:uncharacterized protein DS421_14g470690 [Arachis hypogaea]|nr:uncharacterized protein DS421_14g470690 [Arachis hypogaea]
MVSNAIFSIMTPYEKLFFWLHFFQTPNNPKIRSRTNNMTKVKLDLPLKLDGIVPEKLVRDH